MLFQQKAVILQQISNKEYILNSNYLNENFRMENSILLIIFLVVILLFTIQWRKTQKKRIELAKYQAHIIEYKIRSRYCSKCPYCKEAKVNDELVIYTRKKFRYIFYTYSCVAHDLGYLQCYYHSSIHSILNNNVFDLWKNSGAWAGWEHSNDRIYYAIDHDKLLENSKIIHQTLGNPNLK